MTPEEYTEWMQKTIADLWAWRDRVLADIQPFMQQLSKVAREWYVKRHYHGFFERIVDE